MAKKNMNIYDFLNKEYGIVASAESVLMNTGSKSVTSAEYRKPVNAFALAESLSYIMADPYKQHAQAVTLTAAGESVARGYGELSATELKDKVVDGAKDAWKSFLALIDKLIEVIKQFIRGLFDKEKKLGDVSAKLKAMLKRNIGDSSKLDGEKSLPVAFIAPELFSYIPTSKKGELDLKKLQKERADLIAGLGGTIRDAANNIADSRYVGIIEALSGSIVSSANIINNARSDANTLDQFLGLVYEISDAVGNVASRGQEVTGVRQNAKRQYGVDNRGKGGSARGAYVETADGKTTTSAIEEVSIDKYKEDWNNLIDFYNDNLKELKKQIKKKEKGDYNKTEAGDIEGILVDTLNRNKADSGTFKRLLQWYKNIVDDLKNTKANKELERLIQSLGRLKRSIIKNKDNDYGNKLAQLGRVAVNKFTIIITKTISLNNTVYASLFKAVAINLRTAQTLSAKSNRSGSDDLDSRKVRSDYGV